MAHRLHSIAFAGQVKARPLPERTDQMFYKRVACLRVTVSRLQAVVGRVSQVHHFLTVNSIPLIFRRVTDTWQGLGVWVSACHVSYYAVSTL